MAKAAKTNMFTKAAEKAGKQTAKSSKGKKKVEIAIEGLNDLAAIDAAMKSLEAMKESIRGEVTDQIFEQLVEDGMKLKRRPENFRGIDTHAKASCELRQRSSRSILSESDIELLDQYGVSYDESEDVTTTYMINPAYKDDEALLTKVSNALSKVKGIPEDFIEMQVGKIKRTTNKTSIDDVFKCQADKDATEMLLRTVGVIAVKPTYEGNVSEAICNLLDD